MKTRTRRDRNGGWGRYVVLGLLGLAAVALLKPRRAEQSAYRVAPMVQWLANLAVWIDHKIGWHRLPWPLGVAVVVGERLILRQRNLHDTEILPAQKQPAPRATGVSHLTARTPDGSFNDLTSPESAAMGRAETRFGRNVPNEETHPDAGSAIMEPSPREVSLKLLTRDAFMPAKGLNMLAAAWIQFMIRDWFSHGKGDPSVPWQVPLPQGDNWPQNPMLIPRTIPDPTRPADAGHAPPTFINQESHWWDASQIYPRNPQLAAAVRMGVGGRLALTGDGASSGQPGGLLPPQLLAQLAAEPGWWIGLALMYTLFAREHNAICERLQVAYPHWSDEELFQRARIVNAALIAKIHTVEWTPAIISHPATRYALRANWWGLQGERLYRALGRLSRSEIISGIPGSPTDHHGAPYALTEEFVAVYRMHPLIRDDYSFRRLADDQVISKLQFNEVTDRKANELLQAIHTDDLFYSFGTQYPGAITLHNFPRHLQNFVRPDGQVMDLASVDIMRTRELGVPRYSRFRRLLHLRAIRSIDELTDDPRWRRELKEVYDGDIGRVDLMVGMFAEPKPKGFGFSDTAFRIFILMASRRLKSDRFFTKDYTPTVYSREGLEWIDSNNMSSVLLRHFPALRPYLERVDNAFCTWADPAAD